MGNALVDAALRALFGHTDFDRPSGDQGLVRVLDLVGGTVAEAEPKRDEGLSIQVSSNFVGTHERMVLHDRVLSTGTAKQEAVHPYRVERNGRAGGANNRITSPPKR